MTYRLKLLTFIPAFNAYENDKTPTCYFITHLYTRIIFRHSIDHLSFNWIFSLKLEKVCLLFLFWVFLPTVLTSGTQSHVSCIIKVSYSYLQLAHNPQTQWFNRTKVYFFLTSQSTVGCIPLRSKEELKASSSFDHMAPSAGGILHFQHHGCDVRTETAWGSWGDFKDTFLWSSPSLGMCRMFSFRLSLYSLGPL